MIKRIKLRKKRKRRKNSSSDIPNRTEWRKAALDRDFVDRLGVKA
jgi:hypothetical protein